MVQDVGSSKNTHFRDGVCVTVSVVSLLGLFFQERLRLRFVFMELRSDKRKAEFVPSIYGYNPNYTVSDYQ